MGVGGIFGSEVVQGAGCARAGTFHDVEVDHGGGDVGMAEKAFDCADVGAGFKQVRRNGMKDLLPSLSARRAIAPRVWRSR